MPIRAVFCAAVGLVLIACGDQSQTPADPSPTSPRLTSLALKPPAIWLTQADTFPFTPVGRTASGDSVRPAVSWQATGGRVRDDGRYIAGLDTGTYTVIVRAGTLQARSIVFLAYHIVEVIVTPTKVSLPPGGKQQFKARGRTITGDTVAVKVIWKASGGTITSSGLFTAGMKAEKIIVTATLAPPDVNGQPVFFPRQAVLQQTSVRVD
jgi:hypothetical protein